MNSVSQLWKKLFRYDTKHFFSFNFLSVLGTKLDFTVTANNRHEFTLLKPGKNYSIQVSTVIIKRRTNESLVSLPLIKYFQTGLFCSILKLNLLLNYWIIYLFSIILTIPGCAFTWWLWYTLVHTRLDFFLIVYLMISRATFHLQWWLYF